MNEKLQSVREIALDKFNALNRLTENLGDKLCADYLKKYDIYFNQIRLHENWVHYCIARDVYLQYLGKINLAQEIKNIEVLSGNSNNKYYFREKLSVKLSKKER